MTDNPHLAPVVIHLPKRFWFIAEGTYGPTRERWGSLRVESLRYELGGFLTAHGTAATKAGRPLSNRRDIDTELEYLPGEVVVFVAYRLLEEVQELAASSVMTLVTENRVYQMDKRDSA